MKDVSVLQIIFSVLVSVMMLFLAYILNGINKSINLLFAKIDGLVDIYQTNKACNIYHDAHNDKHRVLEKDINGLGERVTRLEVKSDKE